MESSGRSASIVTERVGGSIAVADVNTFIRTVRECDHELRMLAQHLLSNPALLDDVLQDAYLKAFRSLGAFRGRSALRTWLYRIVYNTCIDELRRPRLVQVPLSMGTDDTAAPADQDRVAGRMALSDALGTLPVQQRAAVLLVDAQGLTYREAARVLEVPDGTVATWVSRARSALRVSLTTAEAVER